MLVQNSLTSTPDEIRHIDNINAIAAYVSAQRVNVPKYPAILPLIQDFEAWFGQLQESQEGILGHRVNAADENEAIRRRKAVNDAMGQKLPDDWTPADRPQTPAAPAPSDPTAAYITVGAVALGGLLLWKLLS
jgi:hypothetical protein